MRKNVKTLLFIFSVILNVGFIGTYAAYKLSPSFSKEVPRGELGKPVFLELDLSADQLARCEAERDNFHARLQELGQQIREKQVELIDLLAMSDTHQQAIEAKQREIQDLQTTVQGRVIVHFLQESAFLAPEQRARFFDLIKERIEMGSLSCLPWVKPQAGGWPVEKGK
ncbi:MAG: periplasmic heavy metal sensor [Candidatus Eisenbacteria bacterium]